MDNLNMEVLNLQSSPTKNTLPDNEKEFTVIARIIAPKPLNLNAFKATMIKAWSIIGKVSTNQLDDNKMAFVFAEEKDLSKVLNNTWTFRDHQTVITWWPPDKAHTDVNLEKARFWVHFFGIPVNFINKENAEAIGNEIGTFIRSDLHSPAQKWRKSLRMQIDLDIHKPLRSTINFACNGGKQILVEVRYERLIDFCHACGRIGHKNPNCTYDKEKKELEDEDNPIGPWLKFEASLIPNPKIAKAKSMSESKMDRKSTGLERPSISNRILAGTLDLHTPTAGKSVSIPEIGPICNVAIIDSCMPDLQNSAVDKTNPLPQKEVQMPVHEKLSGGNDQTGVLSENIKVGEPDNTFSLGNLMGPSIGPVTYPTAYGPNSKEVKSNKRKAQSDLLYNPTDNKMLDPLNPTTQTRPSQSSEIPNSSALDIDHHQKTLIAISHFKKPKLLNLAEHDNYKATEEQLNHYLFELCHGKPK
ncbi:hypothetical protein CASFOL_024355 [Castilleja foliolosa]|uniref:CCHC-type domain-containing protein n=1 Tax=Castilleja foliolosa TaxID=1961234 RepID=A0ABD3CN30_9LAMI